MAIRFSYISKRTCFQLLNDDILNLLDRKSVWHLSDMIRNRIRYTRVNTARSGGHRFLNRIYNLAFIERGLNAITFNNIIHNTRLPYQ